MDTLTIILTVVGILVTLGITAATMLGARKMVSGILSPIVAQQAETRRLLTVGIPCAARVLHIEQTGTSMAVMGEQSYELRLHLEVMPAPAAGYRGGGSGPYRAEMVSLVPMLALPRVQPGCVITVRVDPHDPRKMAFESPTPPAAGPAYPPAPTPYAGAMPAAAYPGAAPSGPHGAMPAYGQSPMPQPHGAPRGVYAAPQPGYQTPGPWHPR